MPLCPKTWARLGWIAAALLCRSHVDVGAIRTGGGTVLPSLRVGPAPPNHGAEGRLTKPAMRPRTSHRCPAHRHWLARADTRTPGWSDDTPGSSGAGSPRLVTGPSPQGLVAPRIPQVGCCPRHGDRGGDFAPRCCHSIPIESVFTPPCSSRFGFSSHEEEYYARG